MAARRHRYGVGADQSSDWLRSDLRAGKRRAVLSRDSDALGCGFAARGGSDVTTRTGRGLWQQRHAVLVAAAVVLTACAGQPGALQRVDSGRPGSFIVQAAPGKLAT